MGQNAVSFKVFNHCLQDGCKIHNHGQRRSGRRLARRLGDCFTGRGNAELDLRQQGTDHFPQTGCTLFRDITERDPNSEK
jgi:hypothetical protein